MGTNFTTVFTPLFEKREGRALVMGLDGVGKTTIVYKLRCGEVVNTVPTIGFNVETIEINKMKITMWDVGGGQKIRLLWKHYYANTDLLIFVVDSTDTDRISEAREELWKVLSNEDLDATALLVMANKSDKNGLSVVEIVDKLQLNNVRDRKWYIQSTCAHTGEGLMEGLSWAENIIRQKKKQ